MLKPQQSNYQLRAPQVRQNRVEADIDQLRQRLNLTASPSEQSIYKIADSIEELEAAYRVVHDVYVKQGFTLPHPSGLRISPWNAVPGSVTFIGVQGRKVNTSVSLYPDSPLGLPMECDYGEEVGRLRKKGFSLLEVGSLASLEAGQNNLIQVMKMVLLYAELYQKAERMVICVHPNHELFYTSILCFERLGEVKPLSHVNNKMAVALALDMSKLRHALRKIYYNTPEQVNLYRFVFELQSENILLPKERKPQQIWNTNMLRHFYMSKTNLFYKMTPKQQDLFRYFYGDEPFQYKRS